MSTGQRRLPEQLKGERGPGRLMPAKTRAFVDRLIREMTPVPPWRRFEDDMHDPVPRHG